MESREWIPLVIQAIIAIGTFVGAWPLIRRVSSQNKKDDVDALKVALEIAGVNAEEQLELVKEVRELKEFREAWENSRYRISVVFKLGESPIIEQATIENLNVE